MPKLTTYSMGQYAVEGLLNHRGRYQMGYKSVSVRIPFLLLVKAFLGKEGSLTSPLYSIFKLVPKPGFAPAHSKKFEIEAGFTGIR